MNDAYEDLLQVHADEVAALRAWLDRVTAERDEARAIACGDQTYEMLYRAYDNCRKDRDAATARAEAAEARIARLEGALRDIAEFSPSMCDQAPYWAQEALKEEKP